MYILLDRVFNFSDLIRTKNIEQSLHMHKYDVAAFLSLMTDKKKIWNSGRYMLVAGFVLTFVLSFGFLMHSALAVHGDTTSVSNKDIHVKTATHIVPPHHIPPSVILEYIKSHHLK